MPGRPALAPHHARASVGASSARHVKRPKSEEGPCHRLLRSYCWQKLCGLTPAPDTWCVCVVLNESLGRCVALENVPRLARGLSTLLRIIQPQTSRSYPYAREAVLGGPSPAAGAREHTAHTAGRLKSLDFSGMDTRSGGICSMLGQGVRKAWWVRINPVLKETSGEAGSRRGGGWRWRGRSLRAKRVTL
eukprot:scaffold30301_cov30-Phaeocystis_antarctica.AAC.1